MARTDNNPFLSATTKIDIALTGELAEKINEYIQRGLYSSKPEVIRSALRKLFQDQADRDFQRARMKMIRR